MRKTDLLEKLNTSKGPIAAVIRHTEREEIKDATSSHKASLTEEGKEDAIKFGKQLPINREIRFYHSWVSRCCETAELIIKGLKERGGKGSLMGKRDFISYHFLADEDKGLQLLNKHGEEGFIKNWFSNNLDDDIVPPPETSRKRILESIITNFNSSLDIYVTHDWNIILLYSYIYNIIEEGFRWPNFLEGVVIEKNNSSIKLYFDDRSKTFDLDDF